VSDMRVHDRPVSLSSTHGGPVGRRLVTSQDLRQEIERKLLCALHSCIDNPGNFRAFK
jgi:hypothetical protein